MKTIWENICKVVLENKWKVVFGIGIFLIFLISHIQIKQELKGKGNQLTTLQQELKGNGNQLTKLQMEVDQMVILSGSYEYNEKTKAHMAKTKFSLNFTDGFNACKKAGGYMFEYPEGFGSGYNSILANIMDKYGTYGGFYVGLKKSDNNVWKWINGKRILEHEKNIWTVGQPTNGKSENCARVKKSQNSNIYGLYDANCSIKSSIICIKRPN